MSDRGVIRNRALAGQIRDFRGMRFGNVTPTDIDAFFEFDDELFVLFETKHIGRNLPRGQRLGLQRLVDAVADSGREAILLIGEHDTQADIDFAVCPVREFRYKHEWHTPKQPITFREAVDQLRKSAA